MQFKKIPLAAAVTTAFAACAISHASVTEKPSTLSDQQSVAVTIYNENLALVKDTRRVTLEAGQNRLALREVSGRMRSETALLRSLSHPGSFSLLEQNFDFDLLTPAKLLEKYVGREVRIFKTNPKTGIESAETALVLAANSGVVLKIGDRIETGMPGRIVYDGVPANLRDRPTLVSELHSQRAGQQTIELSYLSAGLAWKADYVAELNAADNALDLNGWVTLTNQSGTAYPNARLQLVAGDVNRVRDDMRLAAKSGLAMQRAEAPAPATMAQESLFEYHLYTLQRPTTIADNQTKQVALLSAASVPVTKELVLQGTDYYYRSSVGNIGQKLKVGAYVQFENREAARLGVPMPKGVVRVYKKDGAGNAQFVGEDRIDHTPKNETVRLKLGESFDLTADKKQTDFKRRDAPSPWSYLYESAFEIVLKNAKKEAQTVVVREPVPGDWTMLEQSQRHTKVASGTAEWRINVPAESSTTLKYRVLVRH
jgi:hypothetical protein